MCKQLSNAVLSLTTYVALRAFHQGVNNYFSIFPSYYEYLWHRNKGVDASSLFEGLPLSLQGDITLSLYKDLIETV